MAASPSPSAATTPPLASLHSYLRSAATATAPSLAASPPTSTCAATHWRVTRSMRVRIGCEFAYQSTGPTSMLFMVRPREDARQRRLDEARRVTPNVPIHDYEDA